MYAQVRDVRLIMDRNSRRSKGVGYDSLFILLFMPFYLWMRFFFQQDFFVLDYTLLIPSKKWGLTNGPPLSVFGICAGQNLKRWIVPREKNNGGPMGKVWWKACYAGWEVCSQALCFFLFFFLLLVSYLVFFPPTPVLINTPMLPDLPTLGNLSEELF